MIICPNCHRVLDDETYDEQKVYHNHHMGTCRFCGYTGTWTEFYPG